MISQEEFDALCIGDQVKIVDEWPESRNYGEGHPMYKWIGKTMTIRKAETIDNRTHAYHMEEDFGEHDGDGWFWYAELIDHIVSGKTIEPMSMDEIMQLFGGDTE